MGQAPGQPGETSIVRAACGSAGPSQAMQGQGVRVLWGCVRQAGGGGGGGGGEEGGGAARSQHSRPGPVPAGLSRLWLCKETAAAEAAACIRASGTLRTGFLRALGAELSADSIRPGPAVPQSGAGASCTRGSAPGFASRPALPQAAGGAGRPRCRVSAAVLWLLGVGRGREGKGEERRRGGASGPGREKPGRARLG